MITTFAIKFPCPPVSQVISRTFTVGMNLATFSVTSADGYYHCFGCGVSGDVIGFVKGSENVDFMQAVQLLAARAHLEVPAYDDRSAEEAAAKKKKRDRL